MKVALITDGIWPYVLGGMQKHSYYLCKYLAKNNVYVDLFHFNQSSYDISRLEFFSVEEKKFIRSFIVDFPSGDGLPGHYIRSSYKHSQHVYEQIKNSLSEYDFIYTKGFTGWYLIEQKKAGKIDCPPVGVKFHGYEMFQRSPDFKTKLQHVFLLRKPVKWISKHADYVFSYGGKITSLIKNIGVDPAKIIELPSGVESATIAPEIQLTGGTISFLFLGRYERRKGIEELNAALQKITSQNFKFHFIGPIPETKKLSDKRIIYHGEVREKQQLNSLIRGCDVLVCPSWSEGMPNVILEAMANGLAVIATDTGATNVLVKKESGWLIENSEVTLIVSAIQKVIASTPAEINHKKSAALSLMQNNFNWEKLSADLIRILNKIK